MRRSICLAVAMCLLLSGCGRRRASAPKAKRIGSGETGIASWYGHPYHGRRAANGEIYDMEKMTAAHRTLPFNTWVRVKNLANQKIIEVRITDRGPFVRGRIVDLSRAAARSIDLIGPGVARVRLTVIAAPAVAVQRAKPTAVTDRFAVQVGTFEDRRNAERVRSAMERKYGAAILVEREGVRPAWRVLAGSVTTEEEAAALAERLRADSENPARDAFVVRLDNGAAANRIE